MSSLITTVLIIGIAGLAFVKRCDWFNICGGGDQTATAQQPANDSVRAAFKSDKGQKCGCCKCSRVDGQTVRCITSNGDSFDFKNGLSVDAQCQACGSSASICPDEVANQAANKAKNVNTPLQGSSFGFVCQDGFHPNKNGACIPDTTSQKSKLNNTKSNGNGGCKKGQTTHCIAAGPGNKFGPGGTSVDVGTPICSCNIKSLFTSINSYYSNSYHMSKFARLAI